MFAEFIRLDHLSSAAIVSTTVHVLGFVLAASFALFGAATLYKAIRSIERGAIKESIGECTPQMLFGSLVLFVGVFLANAKITGLPVQRLERAITEWGIADDRTVTLLISGLSRTPTIEEIRRLGETRNKLAIVPLVRLFQTSPEMRLEALSALKSLNHQSSTTMVLSLFDLEDYLTQWDHRLFYKHLSTLDSLDTAAGIKGVDRVLELALQSDLPWVRRDGMDALGRLGNTRAVNVLIDLALSERNSRESWDDWTNRRSTRYVARQALSTNYHRVRRILVSQVVSDRRQLAQNAVLILVGIGHEEAIATLVGALNHNGDKMLADLYLNSGSSALREAAKDWAERHGYFIEESPGARPGSLQMSWGTFK